MTLRFSAFEIRRFRRLLLEHLEQFGLDLSGLTVFTEAATGYYMLTPAMCALGGAERVHALARDTRYGGAQEVIAASRELMRELGCEEQVVFHTEKNEEALESSDIVMNAGAVRPIDAWTVACMKPTAVIPLMWETWEFRPGELDLKACQDKGILVMGTDEILLDRFPYAGYLPLKLLFQCNIEVFKSRLLLIGSGRSGNGMAGVFHRNGINFRWINFDESVPEHLLGYIIDHADHGAVMDWVRKADAVVCFEHLHDRPVIADGGVFTPQEMHEANDSLVLVHVSGVVDFDAIEACGIYIHPGVRVPFGTMSIGTWEMGPRSVIELTMAGIKVGEAMARARREGLPLSKAVKRAMETSLAQDFPGENAWDRN